MSAIAPPTRKPAVAETAYYDMSGRLIWSEVASTQRMPTIGQVVYYSGNRYAVCRFALADRRLIVNVQPT